MIDQDLVFMRRCIDLAQLAGVEVKTNPKVGAVIVFEGKIIGEGYHSQSGQSHAEIKALDNVPIGERYKIKDSILYVSLEPCSHFGKTPPCTQRILSEGIKKIVIGCKDPNPIVSGNGIKYLMKNGLSVVFSELKEECEGMITQFRKNLAKRPLIILKWAQSYDNYFSRVDEQIWLSNAYTKILTHKWRTECDGIMIGKNTATTDQPQLNTRLFKGKDPVRIILDSELEAVKYYADTSNKSNGIVINQLVNDSIRNIELLKVTDTRDLSETVSLLYEKGIAVLMVEGGAKLLQSFISLGLWDEARIIKTKVKLNNGINAPILSGRLKSKIVLDKDEVYIIENNAL